MLIGDYKFTTTKWGLSWRPPQIEMNIVKNFLGVVYGRFETHSLVFTINTLFTIPKISKLATNRPCLESSYIPSFTHVTKFQMPKFCIMIGHYLLLPMWPSFKCQGFVSWSDIVFVETFVEPEIVEPSRAYKLSFIFSFVTISDSLATFITQPSQVILHSILSKVPKEMRFIFNLETCLTSDNVLTIPSNILIYTLLTPTTLQVVLFLMVKFPLSTLSYVEKKLLLGAIWNKQPESRIHSSLFLYPCVATKTPQLSL